MTQQYTIVMPIKISAHSHDELHRFLYIQLRSLNKFLDRSSIYEFLIICKEQEMNIIQKALTEHPSPLPIRLISENRIVKEKIIPTMPGWYLQQLLKLGIAKEFVKTPLYLILDTDCFLTKPFSYKDLFYEGKILLDKEPWTNNPDWWLSAVKIIDDTPLTKVATQLTISATPQILVTDIVCELLDYLKNREPPLDWDEYLASRLFTEFSLYWLFLLKTNKTDIYQLSRNAPSLLGNALWWLPSPWRFGHHSNSVTKRIKALFSKKRRKKLKDLTWKIEQSKLMIEQIVKTAFESNDSFHFSLIQSNIHEISVDWIIEQTNKYLN